MTFGVGERRRIALCKSFIKPKMNQIGAIVGNNEVLKLKLKLLNLKSVTSTAKSRS